MQNLATESITIHVTDGLSREEASYVVEQDFPDEEIMESLARPSRPAITRTDSLAATPAQSLPALQDSTADGCRGLRVVKLRASMNQPRPPLW
jgi:hypothetical protein